MTDSTVELDICGDCAQVLANGDCGACEMNYDSCPHGGNERYPGMYLLLGDALDLGWTMFKWCELCDQRADGTDWYRALFDPPAAG